jgi:ubiquinone/menaquinone biosynthesis C-methylase UbiE
MCGLRGWQMTEDLNYTNTRLAEIYDLDNPWAEDTDFYLALAGPGPYCVLDLGCGTGTLAALWPNKGTA